MISYIGFGILIAIFSMGQEFRNVNKPWVVLSALLAIITLTLNFYGCIFLYQASTKLLYEIDFKGLKQPYDNFNDIVSWNSNIFETLIFSLIFTVVVFIWLGHKYLFYHSPEAQTTNQ